MSGGGSFYYFCKLLIELGGESSYSLKTQIIKDAISLKKYDLYLFCRLLLAKEDKRVFHLADKALVKVFSSLLGLDEETHLKKLMMGGDVGNLVGSMWAANHNCPKKSTLTLVDVDNLLDKLVAVTKKVDQVSVLSKALANVAIEQDIIWLCRLITHDLRINIGAKYVLSAAHPQAFKAWKQSNDLKKIIQKIEANSMDAAEDEDEDDEDDDEEVGKKKPKKLAKTFSMSIAVGTPIKPMLAKASKSFEDAVKRCPNGMCVEIKYDGERLQIHKQGDNYQFWSRNLKPVPEWKVAEVKEFIPKSTSAHSIILDCEVLLVDQKTGNPLPFGTFNVHKKNKFADASPCLFVFDILSLEGKSLLETPFSERRQILETTVNVVKNRVNLSQLWRPKNELELKSHMNSAMSKNLEGLLIKDSAGVYTPAARHWLKMKKDYLDEGSMADSADLIVLGAYYGSGNKGSLLSTLLLGVYDGKSGSYRTVCKCGNGLSDSEITEKQAEWKNVMVKCPAFEALNVKFKMDRKYLPDMIVVDPKKDTIVYEIAGAEFSASNHHTASGISIRFPRFIKLRDDKDHDSATSLSELEDLYKASKSVGGNKNEILDDEEDNEEDDAAAPDVSVKKQKLDMDGGAAKKEVPFSAKKEAPSSPLIKKQNDNDSPSTGGQKTAVFQARTVCQWDGKCKRSNANHFKDFGHPGIERKACPYGIDCNRKNPQHFKEEMHWDEQIQ